MDNKYDKLNQVDDYDHDAAEQLAAAINEVKELESKAASLRDLVEENKKLHKYVWTTSEGVASAIHKLEDDHLKNILQYQVNNGRAVSKVLKAEARGRGFAVPTTYAAISYSRSNRAISEGELVPGNF